MTDLDSFAEGSPKKPMQRFRDVSAKTALSASNLPGLDYALNPYVGCAHDCVYCFAPAVLNADRSKWGTDIGARTNLPRLLAKEVRGKNGMVGVGTVTDPYQPVEEQLRLTRKCLEVLQKADIPISVLTKSALVTRDIDLLKGFTKVEVGVTITTYDDGLARQFEPGASPPTARFRAVAELQSADIDTYVMIGPVLPLVSDRDLEAFFAKIASTGTRRVMLDRLRLRPGLIDQFHRLPLMSPGFISDFDRLANSPAYFREFGTRAGLLCSKHGLRLEHAF
jgi:DNA repair photolyase